MIAKRVLNVKTNLNLRGTEMKKEDYKVRVICTNCGCHQTLCVEKGKFRPIVYSCENCGIDGTTNYICN